MINFVIWIAILCPDRRSASRSRNSLPPHERDVLDAAGVEHEPLGGPVRAQGEAKRADRAPERVTASLAVRASGLARGRVSVSADPFTAIS